MALILTDKNFKEEIEKAEKPVLVDFWAPWCGPCFALNSVLEKLAEEYQGKIIFAKANLDESPLIAQEYGVEQVPTLIFFKWAQPIRGLIGLRPELIIKEWLEKNQEIINRLREKIKEIIKNYQDYALKNGFRLNPDQKAVEKVIVGLLANEKKYGARYCPCRRVSGNREEDRSKICPCQWHREEIENQGYCFCRLFVK